MKKIKSITAIFFCLLMAFSGYTIVYADEVNIGVTNNPIYLNNHSEISTFGSTVPDMPYNLKEKGTYKVSGTANKSNLYTECYFTGVESMNISITNKGNNTLTVKVYKMGAIDILRSTKKIEPGKTLTWNVGTKNDANYFLKFLEQPMTFSGTVSNGG